VYNSLAGCGTASNSNHVAEHYQLSNVTLDLATRVPAHTCTHGASFNLFRQSLRFHSRPANRRLYITWPVRKFVLVRAAYAGNRFCVSRESKIRPPGCLCNALSPGQPESGLCQSRMPPQQGLNEVMSNFSAAEEINPSLIETPPSGCDQT
jgi:hypothetical protein